MRTITPFLSLLCVVGCGSDSATPSFDAGSGALDAGSEKRDASSPSDATAPSDASPSDAETANAVWPEGARGFALIATGGFVAPADCGTPRWVYTYTAPNALVLQGCKPANIGAVDAHVQLTDAQVAMLDARLRALATTQQVEQVADVGNDSLRVTAADGAVQTYVANIPGNETADAGLLPFQDLLTLGGALDALFDAGP